MLVVSRINHLHRIRLHSSSSHTRERRRVNASRSIDESLARARTTRWVDDVVIGRNVCPFASNARARVRNERLDVVVTNANALDVVIRAVAREALTLVGDERDERDDARRATTVLVVAANCEELRRFGDFLNVVDACEGVLRAIGCEGRVQIVGFHPEYAFAGEDAGDAASYTNRSPYPMFHLLRESDVARASLEMNVSEILKTNAKTLRDIGKDALAEYLTRLRRGDFDDVAAPSEK